MKGIVNMTTCEQETARTYFTGWVYVKEVLGKLGDERMSERPENKHFDGVNRYGTGGYGIIFQGQLALEGNYLIVLENTTELY